MNITLLEKIEAARRGILATILETDGHTYKKAGEKSLYEVDDPFPVWGNIATGCVDREILMQGKKAFGRKRPVIVRIDTTDPSDIVFGYGSFCGGVITVALEPIFEIQKMVYREVREYLEKETLPPGRGPVFLQHDLATGGITLLHDPPAVGQSPFRRLDPAGGKSSSPPVETPDSGEKIFIEAIHPPADLFLFGATPLASLIVEYLEDMDFRIHVIDRREAYLEKFERFDNVLLERGIGSFDENSVVLILSHLFDRDRETLRQALLADSRYIGLLSSKTRRDRMFEELRSGGIPRSKLDRVSSPVGIDIEAKSDPEIAVSIIAELIRFKNRRLDPNRGDT